MHTRSIAAVGLIALGLAAGCSSSTDDGGVEEASALTVNDDGIAGAWVASAGDVAALVFNLGDSRLESARQAFTAVVKVTCPPGARCYPRYTVRGSWTLDGDRVKLTNFRGDSTPETTVDVGRAAALRKVFGEHRLQRQGDRLELTNASWSASFAYHGTSYCDDYVAAQCMHQFPVCEGRNVPNPRISEWKSLPRSGKCVEEEKRCELVCDTSYREQQLHGQEFLLAPGDMFQIRGPHQQRGVLLPESYEWKSASPSVVVKTKTESLETYAAGTYDLFYRFVVDKNAPRGSVHRIKHASSPWEFTIRVR